MLARANVAGLQGGARVFFALWPDPVTRSRIAQHGLELAVRVDGRATAAAALHMTLVFVGEVPTNSLVSLSEAADSVRVPKFLLSLDRLGTWRGNGVGWLAPSHVPDAALQLSETLRMALREREIAFDAKNFKAHVTIARKLVRPAAMELVAAIEWRVQEFVLMRSRLAAEGARYERVGRWTLGC